MMALISELGLDEDTIFVFTSDNGSLNGTHQGLGGVDAKFFNSSSGLRDGKGTLYEGGYRAPGLVRWKGKVKTGKSTRVTGFEDWMPTLLELCDAKAKTPKDIDGVSFAATLRGEVQQDREFLYREFPGYGGQQSLRMGKWKLIRTGLSGKAAARAKPVGEALYDLAADPTESTDVAAANAAVVTQMKSIMQQQHRNSAEFLQPALDQ